MKLSTVARLLALAGLMITLAGIFMWFGWLAVSPRFGIWPAVILAVPLLFPLPGLVRGRTYTHAWTSMLSLLYLLISMTEVLANPEVPAVAYIVLAGSLMLFTGCVLFVRFSARERRGKEWR